MASGGEELLSQLQQNSPRLGLEKDTSQFLLKNIATCGKDFAASHLLVSDGMSDCTCLSLHQHRRRSAKQGKGEQSNVLVVGHVSPKRCQLFGNGSTQPPHGRSALPENSLRC